MRPSDLRRRPKISFCTWQMRLSRGLRGAPSTQFELPGSQHVGPGPQDPAHTGCRSNRAAWGLPANAYTWSIAGDIAFCKGPKCRDLRRKGGLIAAWRRIVVMSGISEIYGGWLRYRLELIGEGRPDRLGAMDPAGGGRIGHDYSDRIFPLFQWLGG